MSTMPLSRAAAFAAALVATLLVALSSGAAPAQADNCQPEELLVRTVPGQDPNWQSPVAPDASDPRCVLAAQLGCPNQADPAGCSDGIRTKTVAGRDSDCTYSASAINAVRVVVCRANYMVPYLGSIASAQR